MRAEDELIRVVNALRFEFPKVSITSKGDSWFMRALARLMPFNKTFMTNFVTTIGNHIWVPDDWELTPAFVRACVLRHEMVHLRQQRRYGMVLYTFLYLFFPLPFVVAWGRAFLEREAYAETIRARAEYFGEKDVRAAKDYVLHHFTSGEYGWMWPFRRSLERWYDDVVKAALP